MNDAIFRKAMGNVRKYRNNKLLTTAGRRNDLVSEPNYLTTKFFTENLLAKQMKKNPRKLINKPFYLGLSILDLSKTAIYTFWYDYIKPKYGENAKTLLYGDK